MAVEYAGDYAPSAEVKQLRARTGKLVGSRTGAVPVGLAYLFLSVSFKSASLANP